MKKGYHKTHIIYKKRLGLQTPKSVTITYSSETLTRYSKRQNKKHLKERIIWKILGSKVTKKIQITFQEHYLKDI